MPKIPTVTFVTAFLDLGEDRTKDKSPDRCFNLFGKLAATGISICLFVSPTYLEKATKLCNEHSNIYLMPSIELTDTWIYNHTKYISDVTLPKYRTSYHDTFNFLILMNTKIELVNIAIQTNPFKTSHFAWIDFSICHVIQNDTTLERLSLFAHSALKDKMCVLPACWTKEHSATEISNICDSINWRFCGGFFIGDKVSLENWYTIYRRHYTHFLETNKTLVWEVNYWAWLENQGYWTPEYYMANHNDTILHIPGDYLKVVASLTTIPPRINRCKAAIRSLLHQVDHIYLNISTNYRRFGPFQIPDLCDESDEFRERVSIVISEDYGPATKYLGALNDIPESTWVFFCDDDQEYHPILVKQMCNSIVKWGAYQNRYNIVKSGSGGIIHGYVGNLFHTRHIKSLSVFDLPECSRFVDDQWMSVYCFLHNVPIYPTNIEEYSQIFKVLCNGFEQIGEAPLAELGTRDSKIRELAEYFKVIFKPNGTIVTAL